MLMDRMATFIKLALISAAAVGAALIPGLGEATKYKAPASEVLLLPKFCWGQYLEGVDGPEYEIRDCGVLMNHYCDGLLELNRARRPSTKAGERLQHLKHAGENTVYTLNGMKDYPSCMIRQHAETTLQDINTMMKVYGQK